MTPFTPTASADLIAQNVARLKELFPELVTEGPAGASVNVDVLKQLVGDKTLTDAAEKYGLNWHGKRKYRQLALTPSAGTLRPAKADSVDWDTTQNVVIEGDNLEVLKLLQKSYAGKVKLIYIDPPYNTGKDFVYPDNFTDSIDHYKRMMGQVDGEGLAMTSNAETSGRFHTDWLNMMYSRLKVAKELLTEDGVLIVSCDDAELSRLTLLLDECMGEENQCATLVWDRNRKNDAKFFSVGHEYMVVVVKNMAKLTEDDVVFRGQKEGVDEVRELFEQLRSQHRDDWERVRAGLQSHFRDLPADDPRKALSRFSKVDARGPYRDDGNINWPGGGGPTYTILHPKTKRPCKLPASGWRYPTPERFWEEVEAGRIVFGEDETTVPRVRTNLFENSDQVMGSVHYSYAQTAANDFNALFGGERVFQNPKPWPDIKRLCAYLTTQDSLILDFFAGSGTTGHAVMAQNASDGGKRRYILVQLPEPLDANNKEQKTAAQFCDSIKRPRTIAELTKERLRRAGTKIREEHPMFPVDTGFRVFKLDSSNIRPWDPQPKDVKQSLFDSIDHVKPDRTDDDVLVELLLKLGLDLCVPTEDRTIGGKAVSCIGAGALFVCLAREITADDAEAVANGIADWRKELGTAGDSTAVFRDAAFEDDAAKLNLSKILEQRGVKFVRSI